MSDVFRSRGIAPEVREARGYRRYGAGDFNAVLAVDGRVNRHRAWLVQVVRQQPGWVMPKYAVMPDHDVFGEAPHAQLRPDQPIQLKPAFGHDHRGMSHESTDCSCGIR